MVWWMFLGYKDHPERTEVAKVKPGAILLFRGEFLAENGQVCYDRDGAKGVFLLRTRRCLRGYEPIGRKLWPFFFDDVISEYEQKRTQQKERARLRRQEKKAQDDTVEIIPRERQAAPGARRKIQTVTGRIEAAGVVVEAEPEVLRAEADRAEPEPAAPIAIIATPGVLALEAQHDGDLFLAAKGLARRLREGFFLLGGVLALMKERGVHHQHGYNGRGAWMEFCNNELAEVGFRTAEYWITIYKTFTQAGITELDIKEISWTKAREIARIGYVDGGVEILREQKQHLLELARNTDRDELQEIIRREYTHQRARGDVAVADQGADAAPEAEAPRQAGTAGIAQPVNQPVHDFTQHPADEAEEARLNWRDQAWDKALNPEQMAVLAWRELKGDEGYTREEILEMVLRDWLDLCRDDEPLQT